MKNKITTLLLLLLSISLQAQEYLMVADVMPKFGNGGYRGITNYIDANVDYPPAAYFNNIDGEVNIKFIVKNDSKRVLMSPAYMNTKGYGLEEAMMKVLNGMPAWTPGIQDGEKANVWVFLPYKFKLPTEMPYFKEKYLNKKPLYTASEKSMLRMFQDSCPIKDFAGIDTERSVLLDLYIDINGKVTKAVINKMDSSNSLFHKSAIETAVKLKVFTPAVYDGIKVRSIKTISVAYNTPLEEEMEIVKETPNPIIKKKPFFVVDKFAEYPGGYDAMVLFLIKNIEYPDTAMDNDITGAVYIQIKIDETGKIDSIRPILPKDRQLGYGLEQEAMRVIALMPRWIPAEDNNQKVSQKLTIPIMFNIEDDSPKKETKSKKRKKR
jgi:TonB family protein